MDTVTIDARGMQCPLPVIELAREIDRTAMGAEVVLLASDPAADTDVPAWCRMRGQLLVEVGDAAGHRSFRVRRIA